MPRIHSDILSNCHVGKRGNPVATVHTAPHFTHFIGVVVSFHSIPRTFAYEPYLFLMLLRTRVKHNQPASPAAVSPFLLYRAKTLMSYIITSGSKRERKGKNKNNTAGFAATFSSS